MADTELESRMQKFYAEMYYEKSEDGTFQWKHGEEVHMEVSNIWFLIGKGELDGKPFHTLHRHGNKGGVTKRMEEMQKQYRQNGLEDIADDLVLIEVTNLDIETINKCLNNTGFVTTVVEQFEQNIQE